jgi:hypothetical protein
MGAPIAALIGIWRELHSKHPRPWVQVGACAGIALMYILLFLLARWIACGARMSRVVVDLPARRFRFEHCIIHLNMGWPRSTGPSLDIPFDEVLGAKVSALRTPVTITFSTTRGTINLSDRLTNFPGLAAVGQAIASPPPQRSTVLMTLALLIPAIILTGILFQLGIWLKWW